MRILFFDITQRELHRIHCTLYTIQIQIQIEIKIESKINETRVK